MFPSPTPKSEAIRSQAAAMYAPLVVACVTVSLFAQRAHWAVRGPAFGPLHALFGDVYDGVPAVADRLAERAATLGAVDPMGAAETIAVPPLPSTDGLTLCVALAEVLEAFVVALHAAYDRAEEMRLVADCNALQSVIEDVEKIGWMVRSHVVTA